MFLTISICARLSTGCKHKLYHTQIDAYPGQAIYIHIQDRKKEVKEFTLPASLDSTENSPSISLTEPDILPSVLKKKEKKGKKKKG